MVPGSLCQLAHLVHKGKRKPEIGKRKGACDLAVHNFPGRRFRKLLVNLSRRKKGIGHCAAPAVQDSRSGQWKRHSNKKIGEANAAEQMDLAGGTTLPWFGRDQ
jgi:hypothetical protein